MSDVLAPENRSRFLFETVRAVLGPLAQAARFESFLVKKGDTIPNDIARMRGARLVTASESEGGRRLSGQGFWRYNLVHSLGLVWPEIRRRRR